ncbi:MAG: acetate--CoA ligase family protein [Pararhodobacter sp.]|nr:acetate--CoA ligase family protein [Pararhodobacter sp.]
MKDLTAAPFQPLFSPRAVAVIGASETPGSVGRDVVENLQRKGFSGTILPVNPKYETLLGLPCHAHVFDLPDGVDLAAIALPARAVAEAVRAVGAAGIPFAVIFASGFSETGEAGERLQREITTIARRAGVRLIGPNCQGFMNVADGVHIGFGPAYRETYRRGAVSVVSQSGAFGNSILMGLDSEGVGTRHYISTGNEAMTGVLDLMDGLLDDPGTGVISGYVEGLRNPARLRRVAAKARARDVPLVMWKVGRSDAGARAAASHTASLAGDDRLYRAAFAQLGIVEVSDIGEMADCVRALESGRRATGPRMAVVTVSGGAGVAMADRAADLGLELPPLQPDTEAALRDILPAFASVANPLDVTAGAVMQADSLVAALDCVVRDPGVDMLALAFAAATGSAALAIAEALERLAAQNPVPITIAWNAPRAANAEAYARIEAAGVPIYATPSRAVRGLAAIWHGRGPLSEIATPDWSLPAQTCLLNEVAAKAHLTGTGIRAPQEAVVHSADDAARAAADIGYPVVMKLLSSRLAHKSDIGGVRLGLADDAAVRAAFTDFAALPARLDLPAEGVLVQAQITGGIEVILGARIDPGFGPLVVFGAGGVLAELMDDVAIRLAPVTLDEARAMIAQTSIARLLAGLRGRAPGDTEALAQAIAALSQRIADPAGTVSEIEINPLFVHPPGGGVTAGDCVVYAAQPGGEPGN